MYKKITHTIVEEHFDQLVGRPGMSFARPQLAEIMPADAFRAYVEDYFVKMESNLVNLGNATFDKSLDYQTAIGNAMDFETLGQTLGNYYDIEFKERFNQHIAAIIMSLFYAWRNIDRRIDNTDLINRAAQNTWAFGLLLNQYNNKWDKDIIRDQFDTWSNAFIEYGIAKNKNDRAGMDSALTKIASGTSSIAAYVSSGLINQQPGLFTQ